MWDPILELRPEGGELELVSSLTRVVGGWSLPAPCISSIVPLHLPCYTKIILGILQSPALAEYSWSELSLSGGGGNLFQLTFKGGGSAHLAPPQYKPLLVSILEK